MTTPRAIYGQRGSRKLCWPALAAVAGLLAMAGRVPAGERRELAETDRAAIVELLSRFSQAILAGSPEEVAKHLSPALAAPKRDAILDAVANELGNYRYEEFSIDCFPEVIATVAEDGTVRLEYPLARFRYRSISTVGAAASEGEHPIYFVFEKVDGRWYIADSNLFDWMTRWTQAKVMSWIFFGIAIVAVSLFFWGWMLLDCSIRYRSWKYSLLILFSPPVGALYYFFAVWLRSPTGEIGE